jgi:hypothetical protein
MSDREVKDYSEGRLDNTHYNGVPSMYGKMVKKQYDMQPKYCMPGEADGEMRGEHRNEQAGP